MARSTQSWRLVKLYAIATVFSLGALIFALWNGLARGHWETVGLCADVVICADMAILLRNEMRKPRA